MAAERITPVDELTGIPLPLVPLPDSLPPGTEMNWHHHFHPRRHPLLTERGGVAIRTARLQKAATYGNHQAYHQHFVGPPLPETDDERFKIAVLARAGYIPEHAIVMRRFAPPKIVRLRTGQHQRLLYGGQIRSGSPGQARTFFAEYVLGQDLSDIKHNLIDEFVTTTDQERKRFLGHWLLSQAIKRAIIPVEGLYKNALVDGHLPDAAPAKPLCFIRDSLGQMGERDRLVGKLYTKMMQPLQTEVDGLKLAS